MLRRFHDRFEAGRELAGRLPADLAADAVVIGLARGGVQVAASVARQLGAELDALAVRKIGHPLQPEYAIGAVAPGAGGVYVRSHEGLDDRTVAAAVETAQHAAELLDARLHGTHPASAVAGRTVLLVDDGLATGATMIAAVRWAHRQGAARIVVAVPVASAPTVRALRRETEVVCPHEIEDFGAVGLWYRRFDQVSDDEVIALLEEARGTPTD